MPTAPMAPNGGPAAESRGDIRINPIYRLGYDFLAIGLALRPPAKYINGVPTVPVIVYGVVPMARVTVEDCVTKIPNRFELVMVASQRARKIAAGAPLTVERDNDKNPVVALREIAEGTVDQKELEEALIIGLQKYVEMDEPEEDEVDLIAIQQELDAEQGEATPEPKATPEEIVEDDEAAAMDLAGDVMPEETKEPEASEKGD